MNLLAALTHPQAAQDAATCLPNRFFSGPLAGYAEQPTPSRLFRPDHVDIDQDDHEDPMACTTYVNDIFSYLFEAEVGAAPAGLHACTLSLARTAPTSSAPPPTPVAHLLTRALSSSCTPCCPCLAPTAEEAPANHDIHGVGAERRQPGDALHPGGLAG